MRFPQTLLEARLLERRKRFFADMLLPSGEQVVAHCPNPGSMRGNSIPGARAWILDRRGDARKLQYRWIAVESEGQRVGIDTALANTLVREALLERQIGELSGYDQILAEFPIDDSRLDFFLADSRANKRCFVEVKSASMLVGKTVFFPDSPTSRGRKHLELLSELALAGERAVLLFLVATDGAKAMSFADWIDPSYGKMVRAAKKLGVEVYAYGTKVDEHAWNWGGALPIDWTWRESPILG